MYPPISATGGVVVPCRPPCSQIGASIARHRRCHCRPVKSGEPKGWPDLPSSTACVLVVGVLSDADEGRLLRTGESTQDRIDLKP